MPGKDIIVLNDNSKLVGELLEVSKRYIYIKVGTKVHTVNKNIVKKIFPRGQVITFLPKGKGNASAFFKKEKKKKELLKNGFYNISYLNFIIRDSNDGLLGGVGIQNVTGYQFSKNLGLGFGVGLINFDSFNEDNEAILFFSEIRGYFTDKKISAYYSLAIGLNVPLKPESDFEVKTKVGNFVHPAVGYKFGNDRAAFMLDLGVQIASNGFVFDSGLMFFEERRSFQKVVLRLGVML